MYSPKINEEIIPELYKLAKEKRIPITRLTDTLLADALEKETGNRIDIIREKKKNISYANYIFRVMKQQAKKEEKKEVSSEG